MDTLVRFSWLGQAGEQGRRRAVICTTHLTPVAGLKVGSDVSIHTRPVEALEMALFSFINAIVAN